MVFWARKKYEENNVNNKSAYLAERILHAHSVY